MLSLAEANPKANVMGLEVRDTTVDYINSIIAGEKIQNAHAMWYSVANGLPFIASESIESVFYFFPDPWVKTRHSKRRAFTSELLQEIVRILQPSGSLFLATDVPEVDAYQQKLLARTGLFSIEEINGQENWFPFATDHEAFCIRKGIPYKRLNCRMMKSSRTNKL